MTRQKKVFALVATALAVLGLAAGCSDDPNEEELRADLEEELTSAGMTQEFADCAIEYALDESGASLKDMSESPDEYSDLFFEAGEACGTELGSGSFGDGEEILENEDFRSGIIQQISAGFGIDQEQAECVLDALIDEGFDAADMSEVSPEVTAAVEAAVTDCTA